MGRNNIPILLSLILMHFTMCLKIYSVPAYPYKVVIDIANGKNVSIFMRGDENHKYAISYDGYTLLNDNCEWWYAALASDGTIKRSNFRLSAEEDETSELKQFKKICPQGIMPEPVVYQSIPRTEGTHRALPNGPIVGERRALVILMGFKDLSFKKDKSEFDALFNSIDYTDDGANGSVRDYYRFASQGQLDYISDIYGPYTSQFPMKYYGGNNTNGGSDSHPLELCVEALKSLPDNLDYSRYDNDGDGLVDNVHIIFAGFGEESGGASDAIWAHEYPHRISLKNEIGISLAGYSCSPELRSNRGSNITRIGVICHELGHALGAMDYYDTNYGTGGEYVGTGKWDIMASGSWNDDGKTPPNFNPYVRSEVFRWNRQELLTSNQQIVMPRMEINNVEKSIVYKLDTGSEGDYFLIENRQLYKFDSALPGSGMLIYHVHPNIERYSRTNSVNATHPQCLYPVCASYSEPSKKKYGNINSADCPFPGNRNVSLFSPTTIPAAIAWNGSYAKLSLSNILMHSDGSVTFSTTEESSTNPEQPEEQYEMNLIYQESFESGISGKMSVISIMGKEIWRTYKKGNFVTNADLIPESRDGANLLMLFSGKEKTVSESELVSPTLKVEAGNEYMLSFDICTQSVQNSPTPNFSMYVEDQYGEYSIYTLNKNSEWSSVEIPIVFADSVFNYKLYGRINAGGIFIDNIRISKAEVSAIMNIESTDLIRYLYSIDGSLIGRFDNYIKVKSGLYIIRQGNQSRKIFIK